MGAFGFDPLGFSKGKSEAAIKSMQLKEIKNGRLAMVKREGGREEGIQRGEGRVFKSHACLYWEGKREIN